MPDTEAGKRPYLMTSAAVRYRDTYLTVGTIRSPEAWDAANAGLAAIEAEAVEAERERCLHVLREARDRVRQGDPLTAMLDTLNEAEAAIVNPEATMRREWLKAVLWHLIGKPERCSLCHAKEATAKDGDG